MDVCRTCLGTDGLTALFNEENLETRRRDLQDVTGLKIDINDGLPQVVCQPCLVLFNGALKLRQQSALSEATLLQSGYNVKVKQKKEPLDLFVSNDKVSKDSNSSDYEGTSPDRHDDSGFDLSMPNENADVNIEGPTNTNNDVSNNKEDISERDVKNSEDTRKYYNRNTPINRMVTVKGDTYNVKVEIGNVVWESEIKKEKLSKSWKKDMKLKNGRKLSYLKKKDSKKLKKKIRKSLKSVSRLKEEGFDTDNKFDLNDEPDRKEKDGEIGLFDHLLLKKRRTMTKEKLEAFTALAVTPYDKKGPVKCKVCHKELMNFRNFLNHCKIHFAAENTCETCGKEFVNRNSMRYHQMRLHGAEKMHQCKYCDYKGVDVYQMKNHERRVHTGEKPFICNECGVSFYLRAGIAQHMRKHFAIKSIQCDRCPAMFRSRNELTTHRNKVHLMHYTYYCYLCPEKYRAIGTVRKHLLRRHGVPKEQQMSIPVSKIRKNNEITEGPPPMGWQNELHRENILPVY